MQPVASPTQPESSTIATPLTGVTGTPLLGSPDRRAICDPSLSTTAPSYVRPQSRYHGKIGRTSTRLARRSAGYAYGLRFQQQQQQLLRGRLEELRPTTTFARALDRQDHPRAHPYVLRVWPPRMSSTKGRATTLRAPRLGPWRLGSEQTTMTGSYAEGSCARGAGGPQLETLAPPLLLQALSTIEGQGQLSQEAVRRPTTAAG